MKQTCMIFNVNRRLNELHCFDENGLNFIISEAIHFILRPCVNYTKYCLFTKTLFSKRIELKTGVLFAHTRKVFETSGKRTTKTLHRSRSSDEEKTTIFLT